MTPKKAFVIWMTMKIHFYNVGFNAFKYNSVSLASLKAMYEKYKDKHFFDKLSNRRDLERFFLANFVERDVQYPVELLDNTADECYTNWVRRADSLTYLVSNEIRSLEDDFSDYFKCKNGQHPPLLKLVKQKKICIETMVILNSVLEFFPVWDVNITETILWPKFRLKCLKYEPFLQYDKTKIKNLILDIVKHDISTKYDAT